MKPTPKLLAIAALFAVGATANAQSVATVAVNATIVSSVSTTTTNPLSFGSVTQGGAALVVAPAQAAAGAVTMSGAANAGLHITMTSLPDSIFGPGTTGLRVSAYTFCYATTLSAQTSCNATATAKGSVVTANLSAAGAGILFMGATLAAVPATQAPGSYTANMTITVTSP